MKTKVGLIFGGLSKERQVSKLSADNVLLNIDKKKYSVSQIEIKRGSLPVLEISRIDVALIMVHGPGGEDGTLQGVLEILGKPYTGSGVLASALAMNKVLTKQFVSSLGIKTAKSYQRDKLSSLPNSKLVVVKPVNIGSSLGVSITDKKGINAAIKKAQKLDKEILIEEFVPGREFSVPVLGNKNPKALPVIEIKPKLGKFFDYNSKYTAGGSEDEVPARISRSLTKELQRQAVLIHKLLGCRGITRSDYIVNRKNEVYFLEINTVPGMTKLSLVPQAAAAAGISATDLIDQLIALALNK